MQMQRPLITTSFDHNNNGNILEPDIETCYSTQWGSDQVAQVKTSEFQMELINCLFEESLALSIYPSPTELHWVEDCNLSEQIVSPNHPCTVDQKNTCFAGHFHCFRW